MTMTIVEFLEARLAEDEAVARACADADHEGPELRVRMVRGEGMYVFGPHEVAPSGRFGYEEDARTRHFERQDPARILREVAAKRGILEAHAGRSPRSSRLDSCRICEDPYTYSLEAWPCDTVRYLASIYKDHPDFNKHTEGGWTI